MPLQLIPNLLSLLDSTGRVLRVVLEPLLDRFASYKEPKPLRCIRVSCPLHIEVRERRGVRHGLRSAFFDRDEVKLIVDAPVKPLQGEIPGQFAERIVQETLCQHFKPGPFRPAPQNPN